MSSKAGNVFSTVLKNGVNGVLAVLLVASLGLFIGITVYVNSLQNRDEQYIEHAGELRVLSQQMATNAVESASGNREAFEQLRIARDNFEVRWNYLKNGNPEVGLAPAEVASMTDVQQVWDSVSQNADQIVRAQDIILSLHEVAATLSETIPQLQVEYDEIVEILLDNGAPADQVAVAQRQSWLAERIVRSVNKVLAGGEDAVMAADAFGRDASLFGRVLNGMVQGNVAMNISKVTDDEAILALSEVSELFEFVSGSVDEILETSPELFQVREASDSIFTNSGILLNQTSELTETILTEADERTVLQALGYGAAVLAAMLMVALGYLSYQSTRRDLEETESQNQQNQMAILRLLDEIADLADGDLTASATVTEDFTGAIADSINYAIDQMRSLVSAINETAVQVSSAAQETQATAMHLAEASEHQAQEIAGASAAINEMAVSIDQVSANASESSAVAERSVAIANKGAEVVQATINGMDNIREQIQETSKRIKRLGESSQEIGDIISLITDIADQTNILSLNAAIQASMAGDAGRGFAVVADEVQRLAERSAAATKQIEALVKTIQNDTNEAVISMETTTSEVVRGARLAQDAGVALEEIENVSKNLAELIQNISNAARQQASSAGHISNTMNVIQEITSQTSAGTTATAKSIGNLAEMANKLRESVAGFKLPEADLDMEQQQVL
ncbi:MULTISPECIES: methyl-accepting chemotaxis protein [unclassified Oceanobacter]|jgi:twitching motility protein PilJ|uniref:methyl-accepting chemotaxis protein n=1 Tax=unclassified Oceanobacter TaxID=2620260 RepID=UPI0027373AFC|nr:MULTISPECIES: methyl-accepting chemotaxis protein [unclassified Oceanobacter]MDP2505442.1 methyl-accepting chemotaxis protein [Oceanobacter sp. 3_MG-2023]MDP2548587.1 methyl-accepting chemotaxis protein [Oceanobacter sp. 4_MG-2023]MDP2610392.1 methyl-accepting chemotaxis protein [Oceanobacter sp. 1_MG-2023]MDP2613598.1 methyl-accepting chemotaxis protein [Oceanobacter sp. 2_MG-2023]